MKEMRAELATLSSKSARCSVGRIEPFAAGEPSLAGLPASREAVHEFLGPKGHLPRVVTDQPELSAADAQRFAVARRLL